MVSFHLLRAPYHLGKKTSFSLPRIRGQIPGTSTRRCLFSFIGALLVLLPGVKTPNLRSSEGRRLVSFHLLRAPYDLGKRTSFSLPQIRGTLSFHVLRAPCDLGKKKCLFPLPQIQGTSEGQGRCLFSFQALRDPCDPGKKTSFS